MSILTLQLGTFSNFVGAHYWNIQERYPEGGILDTQVEYSVRELKDGSNVYKQNVVSVDRKGAYEIPIGNKVVESVETQRSKIVAGSDNLWEGDVKIFYQSPHSSLSTPISEEFYVDTAKKRRLDLFGRPKSGRWSSFDTTETNWSSKVNQLNNTEYGNSLTFSHFENGLLLDVDTFLESSRRKIEEFDIFGGFKMLVDNDDGFAGLGAHLIKELRDEYKNPLLLYSMSPAKENDRKIGRQKLCALNDALLSANALELEVTTIEIAVEDWLPPFPYLSFDHTDLLETSAIISTFMDASTFPSRLGSGTNCRRMSLKEYVDVIAPERRRHFCIPSIILPLPLPELDSRSLSDYIQKVDIFDTTHTGVGRSLAGRTKDGMKAFSAFYSLRGLVDSGESHGSYHTCRSVFENTLRERRSQVFPYTYIDSIFPTPLPESFPSYILSGEVNSDGKYSAGMNREGNVYSITSLSSVAVDQRVLPLIRRRINSLNNARKNRMECYEEENIAEMIYEMTTLIDDF